MWLPPIRRRQRRGVGKLVNRPRFHFELLLWVAATAIAAPVASVCACGSCYNLGNNPLALPHPRAIEIAIATREEIEKGRLSDRPNISRAALPDGGSGTVSLKKVAAPFLVQAWAARLDGSRYSSQPLAIHFVFIDTEERCGVMVRGDVVLFDPSASFHSDTRAITTRATFYALTSGTLKMNEAEKRGLLIIEGSSSTAAMLLPTQR
jgi:hypothetical protein